MNVDADEILRALAKAAPKAFGERASATPPVAPLLPGDRDSAARRARAYIEKMGPAVEGQGGDDHTFRVACRLRDFGLDDVDAVALLAEWNQENVPPWTLEELQQKYQNAMRCASGTPGSLEAPPVASWGAMIRQVAAAGAVGLDDDSADHIAERLPAFMARLRDRQRPPDIIPGLVASIGITMVHGQPRALKTWALQEMAVAAACGDAAFGLERFHVTKPVQTWRITEEDPELEERDRLACLLVGRGVTTTIPDTLHVSVQRSIVLDDPEWQARTIHYGCKHNIKLTFIDPIRASSAAVDQGPREIRPLATFLRLYMRETGSAVVLGHHDTKPPAGKPDERAKPQRASGGGIFSIADSPIHAELVGPGSRTILTPSHYKFSTAPDPFVIQLEADDPKRPTWVRLRGEDTTAAIASEVALHERILEYLREHPGTSGSAVAKGIHVAKAETLYALDTLRLGGLVDFYKRGQAQLWSALSGEVEP